jgi:hypothetical protein
MSPIVPETFGPGGSWPVEMIERAIEAGAPPRLQDIAMSAGKRTTARAIEGPYHTPAE